MRPFFTLTALLLTIAGPSTGEARRTYSASAYDLEGEELLYTERHVETWADGRLFEREVRYEDPEGELIAEKVVVYGKDSEAPSFEMTDYRAGLREGAEVDSGEVVLFSGPVDEEIRRRSIERPERIATAHQAPISLQR